jgi:hypothetical protein
MLSPAAACPAWPGHLQNWRACMAAVQPVRQHGLLTGIVIRSRSDRRGSAAGCSGCHGLGWAEERQFGRRRIVGKGPHHVQTRHFQRAQALTQPGLQCAFPSPARYGCGSTRPCKWSSPCLASQGCSLPSVLTFSCRVLEGLQAGRQICLARRLVVDGLLGSRALSSRCGTDPAAPAAGRPGSPPASWASASWICNSAAAARPAARRCDLTPRRSRRAADTCALFFDAALLGGQHLDLLLHLHHTGTLVVGRLAQGSGCPPGPATVGPALPPVPPAVTVCSSPNKASSASRSTSPWHPVCACGPLANLLLSFDRRCSARWRPSTTKRISASRRPTSVLASYSSPGPG